MKDSDLKKLAEQYPFSFFDIEKLQRDFNLNYKDLKSIIEVSMKCAVSLNSVYEVLKELTSVGVNASIAGKKLKEALLKLNN